MICIQVCKVHSTALDLYSDAWREDTHWPDLTAKEKRQVSNCLYRLRNSKGKF